MVRTSVNICLWTILVLSNCTGLSFATSVAPRHDLPFTINELMEIPEYRVDSFAPNRLDFLRRIDCQPFDHLLTSDPVSNRRSLATCPAESQLEKSHVAGLDSDAVWSVIRRVFHSHQASLVYTLNRTEQFANGIFARIGEVAVKHTHPFRMVNVNKNALKNIRKLVPAILSSHRKVVDDDLDSILDEQVEEPVIELPGDQQDSYWQYYEDCDRWGVDFAMLLKEAQSIADSTDCVEHATATDSSVAGADTGNAGSRFSFVDLVIAQNTSAWLYRAPQFANKTSRSLFAWVSLAEFNSIESSELEFELLAGQVNASHPKRHESQLMAIRDFAASHIDQVSIGLKEIEGMIRTSSIFMSGPERIARRAEATFNK